MGHEIRTGDKLTDKTQTLAIMNRGAANSYNAPENQRFRSRRKTVGLHTTNPKMPLESSKPKSRLTELDEKWREILTSAKECPAVLGLAAFSEEEEIEVTRLVHAAVDGWPSPFERLLYLLEHRPAIMLVWLARRAGVAYDENFWPNFEREVGANIPIPRREELVSRFTHHARSLMASYTPPPDLGAQHLMGSMLFHAGLPLCHCPAFANACSWAENHGGLPDPDYPDAGEQLRATILQSSSLQGIPILVKALRGPIGPLVCAEALNIVFKREATSGNPRLIAALQGAFAKAGASGLRRSARQAYLRLAPDMCSLEIVGPRQDTSLLSGQCVVWMASGVPNRRGREEEFVFRVGSEPRVEIELRGLSGGLTCRRVFEFDWAVRSVPCLVFDAESRREKRVEPGGAVMLRSGIYWVVHPIETTLVEAGSRYDWPDGRNAISQLVLRPGREVVLQGNGQPVRFQVAQAPFFETIGKVVRTDDAQRIHYGWTRLPEVWSPGTVEGLNRWQLHVHLDHAPMAEVFPLTQGDVQGSFIQFRPASANWLDALAPGLHHLRCVVTRGGRRAECEQEFWYWAGLMDWDEGRCFKFASAPSNIHWPDCRGFEQHRSTLRHKVDARRRHGLAFNVGGQIYAFEWSRTGLFLESSERRAGVTSLVEEHPIPTSIAADLSSSRWLRVWHIPAQQAELRANGRPVQTFAPGQTRAEISLAHLATLFPQGATLSLVAQGLETRLASFHRPLAPTFIDVEVTNGYDCLVLKFCEEIRWVRPRLRELLSGRTLPFEGLRLGTSGHCLFSVDELPTVECANVCANWEGQSQFCRISLDVPKAGWPPGIWFVELEVRCSDEHGWELVKDERGGHACLVSREPPAAPPDDARTQAMWWAAGSSLSAQGVPHNPPDFTGDPTALSDLLAECEELLSRKFASSVWSRVEWIQTLSGELGRQAASMIDSDDGSLRSRLLAAVARESEITPRSLLVTVPSLLASRADCFGSVLGEDALRTSLRWCSGISSQSSISQSLAGRLMECFQSPKATGLLSTLQHFSNFTAVVQSGVGGVVREFSQFDFQRYWQNTIGPIPTSPDESEWSDCDALGRRHVYSAIASLLKRRELEAGGRGLATAAGVFALADDFRRWLRGALGIHSTILPDSAWNQPWLDVSIPNHAWAEDFSRFCSLYALAARAAAAGWLKFGEVTKWLHHRPRGVSDTAKAVTTLVCLAPELLGYYLMFWELIIRTTPHDRT